MKGRCTVCGKLVSLRKDGRLRGHGYRTNPSPSNWCMGSLEEAVPGSWQEPE